MQLSNYILAQICPRSWWGGTSLSSSFLDLYVSALSEHFRRLPEENPRTVFPQWGSRRVDACLKCGPKTLTRPRAVKTDLKSFVFSFFRLTKSIFGSLRTIGSLRAFKRFRFFCLRSLRPKFWCRILFSGSKLSQERYSFVNYKLISLVFLPYFHINEL